MTAGHAHADDETKLLPIPAGLYEQTRKLVAAATIDTNNTIPYLSNRSRDGKRVYLDKEIPKVLPKTKIKPADTLPWHELAEWDQQNKGDKYPDPAHYIATSVEKRRVEELGGDWDEYSDEMAALIAEDDREKMTDIPADIDKRPYVDEKDKKVLAEIGKAREAAAMPAKATAKLRRLKINEISLVDRPANPGARVLLAKREFSASERRSAASSGAAESDGSFPIKNASDLKNAMRAVGRSKNPAKTKAHIRARARALGLSSMLSDAFKSEESMFSKFLGLFRNVDAATESLGHSVKSIIEDADADDKLGLVDETIKQFTDHVENEFDKALGAGGALDKTEDDEMSPEILKALGLAETATEADALKAIADKKKADDDLRKASAEVLEIAKAGMDADELKHHDALKSDDEKKAFRSLSKADRVKLMTKSDDLPEYVRKQIAENEDLKKRLKVIEDERELAVFTKRAELYSLPAAAGEVLMKAKRGSADPEAVEKLIAMLASAQSAIEHTKAFDEFGTTKGATGDAFDVLQAKAAELRKTQPGLTKEQAFEKVYTDPENAALVTEERRANRPAAI